MDYLIDLGINAIWISPVVAQVPDDKSFHGYWMASLFEINGHFGTSDDLKRLVNEAHSRDIWVMLDIVGNHMGNCNGGLFDYSCLVDFNQDDHFHSYCEIQDDAWGGGDQWEVENCRLSGLPDLDQDNQYVHDRLLDWVEWISQEFDFDALRIDTIPEVAKPFWAEFVDRAGIWAIGENFNGDSAYVGPYQEVVPSLINYPLYYTLTDVFASGKSMWNIHSRIDDENRNFKNSSVLANFVSNHDNERFLYKANGDTQRLKSALTYIMMAEGLPVVYYGDEQCYDGGSDPYCREPLWWSNYQQSGNVYQTLRALAHGRRSDLESWTTAPQMEIWVEDNLYVFSRGEQALVLLTNTGDNSGTQHWSIDGVPFQKGTYLCNIFYPDTDCASVGNNGEFEVWLLNGESKVFVPQQDLPFWQ
eukprot:gnl/Dysnectes_brevis/3638_a4640_886.p1 GENE.gnl/Dysnectes_brevis/3638_a4640_886~~gnl/Dysnectes_brevis/3638_a4640_886.p1  ORF type:complete len:482 (-),score=68.48 gnl/Dysnectes_brevis/3638_a4640_886:53-1303(-)